MAVVCSVGNPLMVASASGNRFSQTNAMCWMNDAIDMNTHTGGGFLAGFKRSFGGGGFFITDFTARGIGHVAFAPRFPGTILPIALEIGQTIICRKETFLCAKNSVALEIAWQKRLGRRGHGRGARQFL